jgi:hypothetical protein
VIDFANKADGETTLEIERMDAELKAISRSSAALRLSLAEGLEALARVHGHHSLGFSSVEAYALERCERSGRWVQESRALARRLAHLPAVRRAMCLGEITFSMAQLITRFACPEEEETWLAEARGKTVRAMQALIRERTEGTMPEFGDEPGQLSEERDLTPHHLVRRSAGGDDSDENLASLCVWCHLAGVHGGSLKVDAPASSMTWYIGRPVHTRVCGRERRYV